MWEIKIRNLEPDIIAKLDAMAAKQKVSREEYLRRCIRSWTMQGSIKETEDKYANLVLTMEEAIQGIGNRLEGITDMLEKQERRTDD